MKKILIAALGILALVLSSCTNHQNTQAAVITNADENYKDYAKIIAIPDVVNDLLNDPVTPTVGPRDANKAVVVFFDYGCGKCAEISKEINELIKENHNVKFIFKAYPSPKRDAKVANYASLVANEAYLQGGSELFLAYNKAIFTQRETNSRLTDHDVGNVVKQLGIKVNDAKLKQKAATEELDSRKLGKLIGFHGPHSFVILPTNLVTNNANDLDNNVDKIYVISDKQTNAATDDYQQAAKWSAANIQTQLNKY
ncbi:MAG: thioredoxin domain-containing protein [Francisella endosymbiont of Hyalomma scupense]